MCWSYFFHRGEENRAQAGCSVLKLNLQWHPPGQARRPSPPTTRSPSGATHPPPPTHLLSRTLFSHKSYQQSRVQRRKNATIFATIPTLEQTSGTSCAPCFLPAAMLTRCAGAKRTTACVGSIKEGGERGRVAQELLLLIPALHHLPHPRSHPRPQLRALSCQ